MINFFKITFFMALYLIWHFLIKPTKRTLSLYLVILNFSTIQKRADVGAKKVTFLRSLGTGFGNLEATAGNRPPEEGEPKMYETSEVIFKAASNFCARWCDCCCCMYLMQCCNKMNDQCAIAFTQLCAFLACFECINVCCEICSGD